MRQSGSIGIVSIALSAGWLGGIATCDASTKSIEVLWYTYAHPSSEYVQMIRKLAQVVHTLPQTNGLAWSLTFYGPDSPAPAFANYDVLVIQSGEAFSTGPAGEPDAKPAYAAPNFKGILNNKAAIEAARGERTFISGSDADLHAITGESGNAPPDPTGKVKRVCKPRLVGVTCWDGALGHLVNAVNWAGSGHGLGIVSLVAAEFPGSRWWFDRESFLRNELNGYVSIWGAGRMRENTPVIPAAAQTYALNSALTSKGLGNWSNSFHAGFSHAIPGYTPIVDSTIYPQTAVAIATARFAGEAADGPVATRPRIPRQ
jgi:hypothetical protein